MLSKSRVIVTMVVLPDWFQWWHVKSTVDCHNKMCSKLLCLGQFHVTKVGTCDFTHFYRIMCNVVCGMFVGECAWLIIMGWTEVAQKSSTWASMIGYLLGLFALQMQPVWSQFVPLVNQNFFGGSLPRHRMKYPLHCNYRPRVMKLQHMFSFFYLRHKYNWV
jgi:hypothetical protein